MKIPKANIQSLIMYSLNQSKHAVVALFGKTSPVIDMNSVHKIETNFPEKVKGIPPVTDMNTTTETKPTYEKVIEDMEKYIQEGGIEGGDVFDWLSEYSQINHTRMMVIVNKLCEIKEDYYDDEFDIPEETKKEIFNTGCDIHREGGLKTQQACFYIVRNFIDLKTNNTKAIAVCWNGAGDWIY